MSEIRLNRLTAETGAPGNTDRLIVIPAGAFTTAGTDTAQREQAAANNPPRTWTLESLRTYFQQGIQTPATAFTALTDTPSSLGTAGQFLAVNSASNALEFVDAPSGGGQAETGETIVSKLAALTGAARLSYTALRDTPTIPTLRTAAETATLLSALTGEARIDAAAIKNLPEPQGGGLTSVHTDASLSGLGTQASPLAVANPFTAADETKLDGISAGAEVNQTAAQIVTALEALTGAARLSYSALDGAPAIPAVETGATIVSKLEGLTGAARLDYSALDNTPAIPAVETGATIVSKLEGLTGAARLDYSALDNTPTIPDAEVDEFQFAVATVSQELQADDALGNAIAGATVGKDLSFARTSDAASLGFNDASGRLSFGNTHTDRDTNLIITGRVPITHIGLGGRLRILFREFLATDADTVNREVEVADHPITESASLRSFHFPVTGTQVRVRRNRTYKVFVEFTAEAGAAANGQVSIAYTLNDNANLIAFNRFQLRLTDMIDTPSALGTAGQVLTVSAGGNLLEFVDAASGGESLTSLELFTTLREANALTALADADTLFGWDASSSAGVEVSLATLKEFINAGEDDSGGGASTFLDLTDTPSAFGTAGQFLAVNSATNALEFVAAPSGGGDTVQGGVGPNLLSTPSDAIPVTAAGSFIESLTDVGVRMEDGNLYEVTLERAAGDTDDSSFSPETKFVRMRGGHGDAVWFNSSAGNAFVLAAEFRTGSTGNTALWVRGTTFLNNLYRIVGIRAFAEAQPATGGTFPQVASLPAATEFNQTADLTHLDASNNAPPGLYRTINNPIERRNRTIATIGADPVASNIYGFSLDPANTWGHVDNAGMVGKLVWSTGVPRYCNIGLNTARMGARTQVYIDFGSSEFGTDITRRIRFNRGTTSGNFTRGGITYRDWTVDTTEIDQSSDEVVQRLMELQDAAGDNDITIDVYDAATGGNAINHIDEFVWEGLLSQSAVQPFLEQENRDDRVLQARRIFADNNTLERYDNLVAAIADGVLQRPDTVFKVRDESQPGVDTQGTIYHVDGSIAATDGTRGSVSHRNRFSAMLLTMGNNNGFYYTAQYRSALRAFNNVQNADDIDPNNHIVWMSFYDSGGEGNRPYVDIGVDPALITSNTVSMLVMNRETSTGGNAPQLDIELTRTGQTGTFGGKTGNGYRYTLNATQASALGASGWLFKDDIIIVDFVMDILRSESVININPDRVDFTSGTGYAAPSEEHAAVVRTLHAPWVVVYTNTARTTPVGVGGHWNLDRDIADAFEIRMVWGAVPSTNNGRVDEDSRLLIPPFIHDISGTINSGNYCVRLTFGQYAEYVFSSRDSLQPNTINRVTRVAGPPNPNNTAQLYEVEARF